MFIDVMDDFNGSEDYGPSNDNDNVNLRFSYNANGYCVNLLRRTWVNVHHIEQVRFYKKGANPENFFSVYTPAQMQKLREQCGFNTPVVVGERLDEAPELMEIRIQVRGGYTAQLLVHGNADTWAEMLTKSKNRGLL